MRHSQNAAKHKKNATDNAVFDNKGNGNGEPCTPSHTAISAPKTPSAKYRMTMITARQSAPNHQGVSV